MRSSAKKTSPLTLTNSLVLRLLPQHLATKLQCLGFLLSPPCLSFFQYFKEDDLGWKMGCWDVFLKNMDSEIIPTSQQIWTSTTPLTNWRCACKTLEYFRLSLRVRDCKISGAFTECFWGTSDEGLQAFWSTPKPIYPLCTTFRPTSRVLAFTRKKQITPIQNDWLSKLFSYSVYWNNNNDRPWNGDRRHD